MDALSLVELAEALEAYIQLTIPRCHTVSKYGGTLFTLKPEEKEGQFCGVFMYKKHVQISFSKGAEIADPKSLLSGTGKQRRHLNFTSLEDVEEKDLDELLIAASKM